MAVKFLDLRQQYLSIKAEIDNAIAEVIDQSAYIGGAFVKKFEEEFAEYQQAEFCIGCGNGTDALEIAIEVLNLPPDSEIIVPANSFIASSEAVTRSGHRVVFCDVDKGNYTIDVSDLRKRLTDKTKAIMAVHLYGHPCDMDGLSAIAVEHDLKIIEDCAQAHAAEYKGRRIGAIGDIGAFSFYPGKNLGAYGDGGAIVTSSQELAVRARMIANHGRISKYDHEFEGRNSRLDGLQAAILSVKLQHLSKWTADRIRVANAYLDALKDVQAVALPVREEWAKQVYHLFVLRVERRDELQNWLREQSIDTGVHYPIALPQLCAYDYLDNKSERLFASQIAGSLLSLPIGSHLLDDDLSQVIGAIRDFYA